MDLSRIPLQRATLWKEVEGSLFADLLFSIVEIVERKYENENRGESNYWPQAQESEGGLMSFLLLRTR